MHADNLLPSKNPCSSHFKRLATKLNKITPNDKTSFLLIVLGSSFPLCNIDAIFVFRFDSIVWKVIPKRTLSVHWTALLTKIFKLTRPSRVIRCLCSDMEKTLLSDTARNWFVVTLSFLKQPCGKKTVTREKVLEVLSFRCVGCWWAFGKANPKLPVGHSSVSEDILRFSGV